MLYSKKMWKVESYILLNERQVGQCPSCEVFVCGQLNKKNILLIEIFHR